MKTLPDLVNYCLLTIWLFGGGIVAFVVALIVSAKFVADDEKKKNEN